MTASDESTAPVPGEPGASAQREWERQRRNRESRIRAKHPRTAGLRLRLGEAPQHETAWASGSSGERRVAASLAKNCQDNALFLHDRRIPGTRANIDHIVIARSGIWVIDAKAIGGKVVIDNPLFRPAKLRIQGRDRTKLIEGLDRQVELVKSAIDDEPGLAAPVHGALCFVDAQLRTVRALTFSGYFLGYPRVIARKINRGSAAVEQDSLPVVARHLKRRFLAA